MTERILILPDTHYPLHDKKLWKTILKVVKDVQPDEIIHIGDLLDLPQPSRWTKGTRQEFEGNVYHDCDKARAEILEPLREIYDGPIGVHEGNHDCLDTETRAVTNEGFKYLDELTGDELVMSVDDDGNTIWEPINKIVRYLHNGPMYKVDHPSIQALITGNHRIVGLDGRKKQDWVETTPESMTTHRVYAFSAGRGHSNEYDISDEEIRLAAWCITDSHYDTRYDKWTLYQSGEAAQVPRELLGDLGITFLERERHRDTTEICGVKLKSVPKASYEFTFSSEAASSLVPDKNKIPGWVWELSERQFKLFLDELVFCDGSIIRGGPSRVLYVCREEIRNDLLILCAANGIRANTKEYRPGQWRINISNPTMSGIYRGAMEKVHYKGEVWCLQVPNGRFFIERNGKLHVTGNCRPRLYIEKYAPALAGTVQFNFESLLKFDDYGIEKLPDFYDVAPGWITTHGHLGGIRLNQNSGMTALNASKKIGKSVVMGHTHRAGITGFTTGLEGKTSVLTSVEVGHIMDPKKVTYLKGATGNWQQGLAELVIDGQSVSPRLIPVSVGKVLLDGKVYKV